MLSERAKRFYSPDAQMKMIQRIFAGIYLAWGALLAGHWIWLSDPRWLVVLHTVIFAVCALFSMSASVFVSVMRRRQASFSES
jgi:hypothetical protein